MPDNRRCLCLIGELIAITFMLIGCGGSASSGGSGSVPPPTGSKYIAVADAINHRVLLYSGPITSGQAANIVLGQADFNSSTSATSATGLFDPTKIVADSSGNLWVADCGNNRVVEYKTPFSSGMAASIVLGQPDMNTNTWLVPPTATSLGCPAGLAFDSQGNLWVSDLDNSRITKFTAPFTSGMAATVALGQIDLNSSNCVSVSSCIAPLGLAFDNKGNLFVADWINCRIIEYQSPFVTGMAVSLVIGAPDLSTRNCGTSASTMMSPFGLAFDSAGNFWAADSSNNRVLQFKAPFTTGMSASLVLGQSSFSSNGSGAGAAGLAGPSDVSFDKNGNLYVTDAGNNRTVMFSAPFSNHMSATIVLGEPDMNTIGGGTSATTQFNPNGVAAIQ